MTMRTLVNAKYGRDPDCSQRVVEVRKCAHSVAQARRRGRDAGNLLVCSQVPCIIFTCI